MISSAVIIVGCPRSGTTLLYNILSGVSSLWSLGFESKEIIEKYHHPRVKNWISGSLDASDLTAESRAWMLNSFEQGVAPGTFWRKVNHLRTWLRNNKLWRAFKKQGQQNTSFGAIGAGIPQQGLDLLRGLGTLRNRTIRSKDHNIYLLEKTPENCLRLPFLEALFPKIKIIYLIRDGRANVHSLMEGWRHPHLFPGYQVPKPVLIPGDRRGRWAFTLIPGWEELLERPLEEVCTWQWIRCNQAVLDHENKRIVPYLRIHYEDLINQPELSLQSIAAFIEVPYQSNFGHLRGKLPLTNVLSMPMSTKWRQNSAIERVFPLMVELMNILGYENDFS